MKQTEIKALQRSISKLNSELQAFAQRTEEPCATLYEDAFTSYQVKDIKLNASGTALTYSYNFNDGRGFFREKEVVYSPGEVKDYLTFWKRCLRRAIRYWEMDTETLDAIQDPESGKADIEIED